MAVLRVDSISPAFPAMTRAFGVSPQDLGLLIAASSLPGLLAAPLTGALADWWGRKRVLVPSLVVMALGGIGCVLAPSFEALVAWYLLQGVGSAAVNNLNTTLVIDLYAASARDRAMGYNAGVRSLAAMLYPLISGALATVSWRWPFALSALALPLALIVAFRLPLPPVQRSASAADYLRALGLGISRRETLGILCAGCVSYLIMLGAFAGYFPFLAERTLGATALSIGGLVFVRAAVNTAVAAIFGRLTRLSPVRSLIKIAFGLYGVGFLLLPMVSGLPGMVAILITLGIAEGLNWPAMHTLIGRTAPQEHRAAFNAAFCTALFFGQTAAPLVMGKMYSCWSSFGVFGLAAMLAWGMVFILGIALKGTDRDSG